MTSLILRIILLQKFMTVQIRRVYCRDILESCKKKNKVHSRKSYSVVEIKKFKLQKTHFIKIIYMYINIYIIHIINA